MIVVLDLLDRRIGSPTAKVVVVPADIPLTLQKLVPYRVPNSRVPKELERYYVSDRVSGIFPNYMIILTIHHRPIFELGLHFPIQRRYVSAI